MHSPDKFKHILAITFTNKAANEMKERIILSLQRIKDNDPGIKKLLSELAEETNLAETAVIKSAGIILRNILHNYSDISVGTIDSFVHRIVRSFTYDLHLPMNFEVEMDSDKLLTETIEMMMDRLVDGDDPVTNAIVDFAETNIEEGKSWNLEHSLIKLGKELFNEDAYPHLQNLGGFDLNELKRVRTDLYKFSNGFEQKLFDEGKQAFSLIQRTGLTAQSFFHTAQGIYGYFSKYASETFPADSEGNSYVQKTINEDKWPSGKASQADLFKINGLKGPLNLHYKNMAAHFQNYGQDYKLAKLLLRNFYSFILLADIQKLLEEYKKTNNLIHISDFQDKVHAIVKEQDAPVIYERIGDWYDSILIDEHQDTSVLQWQNLLPLIENSQFKGEDSLVVGDGKQAIYRFRNGKVEQFAMLPKIYGSEANRRLKEREVAINNYGTETKNLDFNFRSRKAIMDFNNELYNTLSALPELVDKSIYHKQAQKQGKDLEKGFVRIEFLPDGEEVVLDEYRCQRVESIVQSVLQKGYDLKDIAVLTRSRKNGSLIASHLINKGFQVISTDSLLINNSPKTKLVLATLRYFDRKEDHIARAEMTYFIHLLLLKREFRFEQFDFKSGENLFEQKLSELLGREFHSADFLSFQLVSLIHELLVFFGLDDDDPFLQFFLDEAMVFSSRNRSNIREFLDWWEEVKDKKSIIYPDTLNAVKIMTIHRSKGLQFPVVILADADWPQRHSKKHFWVEIDKPWLKDFKVGVLPESKDVMDTEFAHLFKEEEASSFLDMLNLFYVATTRPEDLLYILSTKEKKEPDKNASVTALLITFLKSQGLWQGFGPYQFGSVETEKEKKTDSKQGNIYTKEKVEPGKGAKQITIRKNSRLLWNEEKVEKMDRGTLLHGLLKQVKYFSDIDKAVDKIFHEGLIDDAERKTLQTEITDLLSEKRISAFYSPPYKVINERPLLNAVVIKIPDRVVVDGNNATVIDYKTGAKRPADVKQIKDYVEELKKFGFEKVKGFVIYTEDKSIDEIEELI
ncbi:MAG: addA [Bacteroidota bacterium]|nr:addA [Bacteroidota bacterium]